MLSAGSIHSKWIALLVSKFHFQVTAFWNWTYNLCSGSHITLTLTFTVVCKSNQLLNYSIPDSWNRSGSSTPGNKPATIPSAATSFTIRLKQHRIELTLWHLLLWHTHTHTPSCLIFQCPCDLQADHARLQHQPWPEWSQRTHTHNQHLSWELFTVSGHGPIKIIPSTL